MEIYILHGPLVADAIPNNFPQLRPRNYHGINSGVNFMYLNWFYGWILPLIYGLVCIPLHYLDKPI